MTKIKEGTTMFIRDISSISPQFTFNNKIFENEIKFYSGNRYLAIEPDYKNMIPLKLLRRMGKAVRMGIGAGLPLMKKHPDLGGIIIGTANGGLEDCIKFLNQIISYDEGSLTPTNFVQSIPNSVAGHLALMSTNTGYNITHAHKGLAFESSLLDAKLLFEEKHVKSLLVGNVEEISDYNYNIDYLAGLFKETEIDSGSLLNSNTKGTVCGEGSTMFVLESSPSNSFVEIKDVDQICYPTETEIIEKAKHFLGRNNLSETDIDAIVLGLNGDNRTDFWYHNLSEKLFKNSGVFTFKNLVGEYPTASAFATWLSVHILQGQKIPNEAIYKKPKSEIKNILIYNHYSGNQHGFILISKLKKN